MKCTDNKNGRISARRRRQKRIIRIMTVVIILLCIVASAVLYMKLNNKDEHLAADYEKGHYNTSTFKGELFSADLCVASENVDLEEAPDTNVLKAAALFDLDNATTDYAYNIHEKVYPASTTKIMTALVAINNADLSDTVTVQDDADMSRFAADEQTCGIKAGDQLTLKALLYGLLLYSGNDNAVAIADYVGGSIDGFAEMMNAETRKLMATNTHFVNPNGLHNENHYTTAYDLYLIFNECIKHKEFVEIIQADSYTANITAADGTQRQVTWEPTNYYAREERQRDAALSENAGDAALPGNKEYAALPENATIIGGKTGTTKAAGNCLILLNASKAGKPYISVIMGAETKDLLYSNMTTVIGGIPSDG